MSTPHSLTSELSRLQTQALPADLNPVTLLNAELRNVQQLIASQVKTMLREQFQHLAAEIKGIKLEAVSMGYQPPEGSFFPSRRPSGGGIPSMGYSREAGVANSRYLNASPIFTGNLPGNEAGRQFWDGLFSQVKSITAKTLEGTISAWVQEGFRSAVETERALTQAEANFALKAPTLEALQNHSPQAAKKSLQTVGIHYGIEQPAMAEAYNISSQRYSDPAQALLAAQGLAKLNALGGLSIAKAFEQVEAISAQWQVDGSGFDKLSNMLLKTQKMFNTGSLENLVENQKQAGAVFLQNMPGESKGKAMATSLLLNGLFSQSMTSAGGGAFWKNVLDSPYNTARADHLENLQRDNPSLFQGMGPLKSKAGLEIFTSLLETVAKVPDSQKHAVAEKVFSQFFRGTAYAGDDKLQALTEDAVRSAQYMNAYRAGHKLDPNKSVLDQMVAAIQSASETDVESIRLAQGDPFAYRSKQLKSQMQASASDVFEELKPALNTGLIYLNALLRGIQHHSFLVAKGISLLSKIAMAAGARALYSKASDWVSGQVQNSKAERIDEMRSRYNEMARSQNLKKLALETQIQNVQAHREKKHPDVQQARQLLQTNLDKRDKTQQLLHAAQDDLRNLDAAPNRDPAQRSKIEGKLRSLSGELSRWEGAVQQSQAALNRLDDRDQAHIKTLQKLNAELGDVVVASTRLNRQMDLLDEAGQDLGVDLTKLTKEMNRADTAFDAGGLEAGQFAAHLQKMNAVSTASTASLRKMGKELANLDQDFHSGALHAEQYTKGVNRIQRAQQMREAGLNGDSPDLTGEALLRSLAAANPQVGRGVNGVGEPRRGIFDRFRDVAQTRSWSAWRNPPTQTPPPLRNSNPSQDGSGGGSANALTTLVGGAAMLFKGGGGKLMSLVKPLLKKAGPLGLALTAMDLVGGAVNPLLNIGMEKDELAQAKADNKLARIRDTIGYRTNWLSKAIGTFDMGISSLGEGLGNLLGGELSSNAGFGDTWDAIKKMWTSNQTDEALAQELKDQMGVQKDLKTAADEAVARHLKELKENPTLDLDGDSNKDETDKTEWGQVSTLQEGQQMVEYINSKLSLALARNNSEFETAKALKLISGVSEDSAEMRQLFKEFFEKNIKALDEALVKIDEREKKLKDGWKNNPDPEGYKTTDAWQELEQDKAEKQQSKVNNQLQAALAERSEVEKAMNDLNDARKLSKLDFAIQRSNALLNGSSATGERVKSIEQDGLQKDNEMISATLAELHKLQDKYKGNGTMTDQILLDIKSLQAESNENQLKMRDLLAKSMSTFNLPDGIQPMTYLEAMTQGSTHQNVSMRAGDVIVNVTLGAGLDSRDADQVGRVIADHVRNAQTDVANQLGQQVKSNFQGNYRSLLGG